MSSISNLTYAETLTQSILKKTKEVLPQWQSKTWFFPPENSNPYAVYLQDFQQFDFEEKTLQLPHSIVVEQGHDQIQGHTLSIQQAVHLALQQHPKISQDLANLAGQHAYVDVARAGYFPQLSGGFSTGDFNSGERGRQLISLNATQLLFDFGKVEASMSTQQAKLLHRQASVLSDIDDIALEVAQYVIQINRYQDMLNSAHRQVQGIQRIAEIAHLRANAGISSQADPVQAVSYLESAQSTVMMYELQLRQYQQKLNVLLGQDVGHLSFDITDDFVMHSKLKDENFNIQHIAKMIAAQAEVVIAEAEKKETELTRYPTVNIKGSLSQAVNGRNPNNMEDNGFYTSVMLEASAPLFQGGATTSRIRAALYAKEAALANVEQVIRSIKDQALVSREEIYNKEDQIKILRQRQQSTLRTKELYQEQYKLGKRTVLDLLNAEQAIHNVNLEIEAARYDIYISLAQYIAATGRNREVYQLHHLNIQGFSIQP